MFAQLSLKDVPLAWNLAHRLCLDDDRTWSNLGKAYENLEPLAVLVYTRPVERELTDTDPRNYRSAARRLKKMRKLAAGSSESAEIDEFIADLRERYRRRPRLQQELDLAGLTWTWRRRRRSGPSMSVACEDCRVIQSVGAQQLRAGMRFARRALSSPIVNAQWAQVPYRDLAATEDVELPRAAVILERQRRGRRQGW